MAEWWPFLTALWCIGCCTSDLTAVPVLDLAASREQSVEVVSAALRRYGFFYAKNHGIPDALIRSQFEQSRELFALPPHVKRNLTFVPHLDIGYLGSGGQALDEESGVGDTKEGYMMTNNGIFDPVFKLNSQDPLEGATLSWPPANMLPQYQRVMRSYTREVTRVNHELNGLLFASLGLNESDQQALASAPFTVVKQLRYQPAQVVDTATDDALGAGAHADWGALTLLATDGTPGLEVELDGGWVPVPPRDGCLIVNAGDQIFHWTNGEYRSANHRVVPVSLKPRYSTAFFTYFDFHAVVSPLPQFVSSARPAIQKPMTTREYFHFKLFESTGNLALLEKSPGCSGNTTATSEGECHVDSLTAKVQ